MADNNKAQLFLNGKDIEAVDWQISAGINGGWKLTVTYSSGKNTLVHMKNGGLSPA